MRTLRKVFAILALTSSLAASVFSAESSPEGFFMRQEWMTVAERQLAPPKEVIVIPRLEKLPTDPDALAEAILSIGAKGTMRIFQTGAAPKMKTEAAVAFDDHFLYAAFRGEKSPTYSLKAHIFPVEEPKVWYDDCYELFVDPYLSRTEYVQVIANSLGQVYDALGVEKLIPDPKAADPAEKMSILDLDQQFSSNVQTHAKVEPGRWTALMKVPFAAFGVQAAPVGSIWGLNLCRANWENGELSQWFVTRKTYHDPRQFGAFSFGEPSKGVAARLELRVLGYGTNLITIHTENAEKSHEAELIITLADRNRKPVHIERKPLRISPGTSKHMTEFRLPFDFQDDSGRLTAQLVCGGRSTGFLMNTVALAKKLQCALDLPHIYTSDKEMRGVVSVRLGERSLERAALRFVLKGPNLERRTSIQPLPGNYLRFILDPRTLQPGEYSLGIILWEGEKELENEELRFSVIKPPFDF